MAIERFYSHNFQELVRAIMAGDVGLMECHDAKTKEPVVVICAFQRNDENNKITTIPLAKMFDGNPYDQLIPPALPLH